MDSTVTVPVVTVTNKPGSIVGTVIARVSDPSNVVRDVNFYYSVNGGPEIGPNPPAVARRPAATMGVYEFDILLDAEYTTTVRTQVVLEGAATQEVQGLAVQTFGVRTGTAAGGGGGGGAGYALLSGAAFTGEVSVGGGRAILGVDGSNGNAKLELGSSTAAGTLPYIDFHHGIGAEQDYNARLVNDANNLLTVYFAGAGTFNVQGTIQQNGAAVALAGHAHDDRYAQLGHAHDYLGLGGGALSGTLTGTVFQASGGSAAFHVGDRGGLNMWAMYASGNALRWWYGGTSSNQATLDGPTGRFAAPSLQTARGTTLWGSALLYDGTEWDGGGYHPTVGSTGNGGLIMLIRPHVPHLPAQGGAWVRYAGAAGGGTPWDVGVGSDVFFIRRGTSGAPFLNYSGEGTLHLERTDSWTGDVPHGKYHLQLRSASAPAKKMVLGYHDDGSSGFGFIASGHLGAAWTVLALNPSSGMVAIGKTTVAAGYHLDVAGGVIGGSVAARGAHPTWGGALLSDRTDWAGAAHPTLSSAGGGGIIMLARPHVPFVTGAAYQGDGAYVRMATDDAVTATWDMGTFGDQWAVRRGASGAMLRVGSDGRVSNTHGHPIGGSTSGSGAPAFAAADGTLYLQT